MDFPTVEEVNKMFKTGMSFNSFAKEMGKHKNTIKNYYAKLGYKYNRDLHQFVAIEDNNNNKDIGSLELEQRVQILEEKVNALTSIKATANDFALDSRVLRTDIKTRSIKISASAMQAFTKLAETKLSMYAKQDLLAMALLEFVDKYNN